MPKSPTLMREALTGTDVDWPGFASIVLQDVHKCTGGELLRHLVVEGAGDTDATLYGGYTIGRRVDFAPCARVFATRNVNICAKPAQFQLADERLPSTTEDGCGRDRALDLARSGLLLRKDGRFAH